MNYNEIKKKYIINALDFEKQNFNISEKAKKGLENIYEKLNLYIDNQIKKGTLNDRQILINSRQMLDVELKKLEDAMVLEMVDIANSEFNKSNKIVYAAIALQQGKEISKYKEYVLYTEEIIRKNKFFTVEFVKFKKDLEKVIYKSVKKNLMLGKAAINAAKESIGKVQHQQLSFANVKTITRSMMKSVQNEAVIDSFKENDVEYVKLLAILDNRTTEACTSLNNKVFKVNDAPVLPLHYNCRSTLIFVAPWDLNVAKNDIVSFKKWYRQNKDDPDLKRLKFVF